MIPNKNGYQAYQKNKYETASPHRLIMMLYDGAIRFMNQSGVMIDEQNVVETNQSIQKAQDIIYELIACLNFEAGKEIAENLNQLYTYVIDLLIKANIDKDKASLHEAISIITELKQAWEEIGKEVAMSNG